MENKLSIVDVLQAIQGKLIAPKSQRNEFGKYNYRNCEDILEALKPILGVFKSAVVIKDEIVQIGDRFYIKATATLHYGEFSISSEAFAREPLDRKGMDASQITGATSSYARKYALNGLFAIDDQKDPDSADNREHTKTAVKITTEQLGQIRDGLIANGDESKEGAFAKFMNVDSLENLPATDFQKAISAIEAKKAKKAKGDAK